MAISARSLFLIWIVIGNYTFDGDVLDSNTRIKYTAASSPANGTCVLDSDFGFTLNCGFKQSGLFRVRNLGGVKGYWGVGFSVGDELGFRQSLSNTEGNRRRSTQGVALGASQPIASQRTSNIGIPTIQSAQALYVQRSIPTQQTGNILPPFKPIPVSSYSNRRDSASNSSIVVQGGAVAAAAASQGSRRRSSSPSADVSASVIRTVKAPTLVAVPVGTTTRVIPAFQALPHSTISRTSDAGEDFRNSLGEFIKMPQRGVTLNAVAPPNSDDIKATAIKSDSLSTRTLGSSEPIKASSASRITPTAVGQSMEAIAKASNVSVQTVATAIAAKLRRRQQAIEQQAAKDANAGVAAASPQAQSGMVTKKHQQPKPVTLVSSRGRVMNAPREYYPVGYDKDFDDGFAARVDLPDTSFSCGQQKHFPGLYADEDLGCMVFHVCALTDEGLIMKSFLCPESTLFDQTILKCNWWFYVDCKASKKLYDSNIPVSKSYQLMKALAFFSSYKS